MPTKPDKERTKQIKETLKMLVFATQSVPEGGPEGMDFYVRRLDGSSHSIETIRLACDSFHVPAENEFERRKFPILADIFNKCLGIERSARVKAASATCEDCDGEHWVVRTRDGFHPCDAPKGTPTHAVPCPSCRNGRGLR